MFTVFPCLVGGWFLGSHNGAYWAELFPLWGFIPRLTDVFWDQLGIFKKFFRKWFRLFPCVLGFFQVFLGVFPCFSMFFLGFSVFFTCFFTVFPCFFRVFPCFSFGKVTRLSQTSRFPGELQVEAAEAELAFLRQNGGGLNQQAGVFFFFFFE